MKKVIALAIASALTVPTAFAAEDELGMKYTSASEGFYASIRTRLQTNTGEKDTGAAFRNSSSRIGVQGSNDLGNGLSGNYQWEVSVGDGDDVIGNRLRYVGLSGNFGSVNFGQMWETSYNYVYGSTDIAQVNSGYFAYDTARPGRINNVAQYDTPDLNGFQGGLQLQMVNNKEQVLNTANEVVDGDKDDNQLDRFTVAGRYAVAGFTFSATYDRIVDGLTPMPANLERSTTGSTTPEAMVGYATQPKDDLDTWAVGTSYAQDNWYVAGWYGATDQRRAIDGSAAVAAQGTGLGAAGSVNAPAIAAVAPKIQNDEDTVVSIAGNVDINNVTVYGVWEQNGDLFHDNDKLGDFSSSALGVVYFIGSNSRVWVEYAALDDDNDATVEDNFTIGLRHDF